MLLHLDVDHGAVGWHVVDCASEMVLRLVYARDTYFSHLLTAMSSIIDTLTWCWLTVVALVFIAGLAVVTLRRWASLLVVVSHAWHSKLVSPQILLHLLVCFLQTSYHMGVQGGCSPTHASLLRLCYSLLDVGLCDPYLLKVLLPFILDIAVADDQDDHYRAQNRWDNNDQCVHKLVRLRSLLISLRLILVILLLCVETPILSILVLGSNQPRADKIQSKPRRCTQDVSTTYPHLITFLSLFLILIII